ncbi:hypothetical protein BHYA_0336g00030 [Botrytis hyacinthi]|uniref:Uncharacterized protein n=1 Tax=Botrytis hyacinthi TaxID=278943 RepID=A0A4Z1G9W2_9HELO|nr:hypothetical protein BHYA_0336g00030 [Botrytis hyacinthi]
MSDDSRDTGWERSNTNPSAIDNVLFDRATMLSLIHTAFRFRRPWVSRELSKIERGVVAGTLADKNLII